MSKKGADADEQSAIAGKQQEYQMHMNSEFEKYAVGEDSEVYLAFQPIWSCKMGTLIGLEVLCRVMNGLDAAPMPGLAVFQANRKIEALRFLQKQCEFAVDACQQLTRRGMQDITVSVNVRPDELLGAKDFMLKSVRESSTNGRTNLLFEITEYAPITADVISLLEELKKAGAVFALDDVTEVNANPGKAMAKLGEHACSFALAKEQASLFAVQKLDMKMACSVFRQEVFPTPEYDGGKAQPFLKSMIFPVEETDEIQMRNHLVVDWFTQVRAKNPEARFVIECSVYVEDLVNPDLVPNIPLHDGPFSIQGGRSGGRAFPLEAFLPI